MMMNNSGKENGVYSLKSSELSQMTKEQKEGALGELIRQAVNPTQEEREAWYKEVEDILRHYEQKYGVSSQELRNNPKKYLHITEIGNWLIVIKAKDYIDKKLRRDK